MNGVHSPIRGIWKFPLIASKAYCIVGVADVEVEGDTGENVIVIDITNNISPSYLHMTISRRLISTNCQERVPQVPSIGWVFSKTITSRYPGNTFLKT